MVVGRDAELRVVDDLVVAAKAGAAGALAIRGEAGTGKSTLVRHAVGQASGMTVLQCSGVEFEANIAFSGLHQLLAPVVELLDELPADQADALRAGLGLGAGTATDLAVRVATLNLLTAAAARRPVLVVADDFQWLDGASAATVLFALRRSADHPIAVLLGIRDPSDVTLGDVPELRLTGLGHDAAETLLEQAGWRSSPVVREALIEATGGNPLALVELARTGASGEFAHDLLLRGTVPLNRRLHDAFGRRVDALPGRGATLALLLAADTSSELGPVLGAARELGVDATALAAVEEAGLVTVSDAAGVTFTHPLMRSAVYQRAPFHERATVHAALARQFTSAGDSLRAVHHLSTATATPDEQVASELERAAEAMTGRGGQAATAHVLVRAARLSPAAVDRRRRLVAASYAAWRSGQPALAGDILRQARTELDASDAAGDAELSRLTGLVEVDNGDPAVAFSHLARSADTLTGHPDDELWLRFLGMEAALHAGDLAGRSAAAERIGAILEGAGLGVVAGWMQGGHDGRPAPETADPHAVLALVPASGPAGDPRRDLMTMAIVMNGPDLRAGRVFGIELAGRYRDIGMTNVLTIVLTWLAELEYHLGLWDEGRDHAEESASAALDSGQMSRRATSLAQLARVAAVTGDPACARYADDALALAVKLNNRTASATARWARGLDAMGRIDGEPAAAMEHLLAVASTGSGHGNPFVARHAMADIAEAAQASGGASERVRDLLTAYVAWAGASTLAPVAGNLARCRAVLDADTAEAQLTAVLDRQLFAEQPFAEARTRLALGAHLRRARRPTEAREHLRQAELRFTELGATPWATRALAELRAAGGGPASVRPLAGADLNGLTAQELQVAQLAAQGMSNKEIGAELYLSPRTVGYHLYKIFPKLGISSRAQLRRMAPLPTTPLPATPLSTTPVPTTERPHAAGSATG